MSRTVEIDLGARRYPIHVGAGIIGERRLFAAHVADRHAFVVTNETVAPLYLDRLRPALADASRVDTCVIADGEQHKTLDTFAEIQHALVERRAARDAIVIALGGGVVGDIAGFAAACYQRGVDFLQVPTTLLAQVDSSVGGKTGVNLPGGKNLVGAFHQPRCVVSDTATLATLDPREIRAGFAEIVKYGLIDDPELFDWLEANVTALLDLDDEALGVAVVRACERKAALVVADERESGVRALLNLGHTFAHAIEAGSGYGAWLHGEAVAAGIVLASRMSHRMGWLTGQDCERIERLLARAGLPTRAPAALSPQRMYRADVGGQEDSARATQAHPAAWNRRRGDDRRLRSRGAARDTGNGSRGGMTALASHAVSEATSRGRAHAEDKPAYRSAFQRDRDRIIHSAAFRRLEYKTQVFVNHEGDMFRTRLTHSIEVAQISRTIARALGLNEDLVEAIALAHDLGHTPFGHAGQDALNACMREHGGFEHNLQSLRVVDLLEERYASFPGLNLTYETREGILKHCSRANARRLGALGERFLTGGQPSLEAQVANLADEIAYNNHDVDDGLRAGLLDIETLTSVEFFREQHEAVRARWPALKGRRIVHETIRAMINRQATDLLDTSRAAIDAADPRSVDDVRGHRSGLVRFSSAMLEQHRELKQLLGRRLYRHYRVFRMSMKAQRIVKDLFDVFFDTPRALPHDTQRRIEEQGGGESERARLVADYVAGMTDRFAIAEYGRLFTVDVLT